MVTIFVASNTGYAGRTFISLGLALKLMDMGYKVGVMKSFGTVPVKSGKDVYDADALFTALDDADVVDAAIDDLGGEP